MFAGYNQVSRQSLNRGQDQPYRYHNGNSKSVSWLNLLLQSDKPTGRLGDIHTNDIGTLVELHGAAIRTGHHCAMPVAQFFGLPATARASLGIYNTFEEIDILADALEKTRRMFV